MNRSTDTLQVIRSARVPNHQIAAFGAVLKEIFRRYPEIKSGKAIYHDAGDGSGQHLKDVAGPGTGRLIPAIYRGSVYFVLYKTPNKPLSPTELILLELCKPRGPIGDGKPVADEAHQQQVLNFVTTLWDRHFGAQHSPVHQASSARSSTSGAQCTAGTPRGASMPTAAQPPNDPKEVASISAAIRHGVRSEVVLGFQNWLISEGYNPGKADSIFGKRTARAGQTMLAARDLYPKDQIDGIWGNKSQSGFNVGLLTGRVAFSATFA